MARTDDAPGKPVTALALAQRFLGVREVTGQRHNPLVVAMLRHHAGWIEDDETAWCGAFVGFVCFLLDLPTPKGAAALTARQWLTVGEPVDLFAARPGFDVVILKRGPKPQPGPEVVKGAPGHVGFYVGREFGGPVLSDGVVLLGGNQSNRVGLDVFPASDVIGVRRLWRESA